MKDAEVIRVFSDWRSNPEKYLRIGISSSGAYIHLTGNQVHLSISHAILAEFVANKCLFYYSYDSQTSELAPNFTCSVAMKKNKELAYSSGLKGDKILGYIRCKPKDKGDEYETIYDEEDNKVDSIFFGIVSTKIFTIVFAADTQHSKTLQIELLRADENQPSLEDIIATLNQLNQNADWEVLDGQEEK